MTRIAITADVHAEDYPYARVDPETGMNARFTDMVRTARWVAASARELGAEVLVMAGDYTESKVPPRTPRAAKIAQAFDAGPARQVHLRGNHDSEWAGESIVSVLGRTPGWDGFMRPGIARVGDVAICAIPHLERRHARVMPELVDAPTADLFRVLSDQYLTIARGLYAEAQRDGARRTVLVGHQQLAGSRMTDAQRSFLGDIDLVVDAQELATIGFDAVVMGHVHRAQAVVDAGHVSPVLYAGSQERVDFAEEHERKSFVILELGVGGMVAWENVEIPARRFLTLGLSDHTFNPAAVEDAIVRAIDLDPAIDVDLLRHDLLAAGAFAVTDVRRARTERAVEARAAAIAEAGGPEQQLAAALEGDPLAERLLERGRRILAEVAA